MRERTNPLPHLRPALKSANEAPPERLVLEVVVTHLPAGALEALELLGDFLGSHRRGVEQERHGLLAPAAQTELATDSRADGSFLRSPRGPRQSVDRVRAIRDRIATRAGGFLWEYEGARRKCCPSFPGQLHSYTPS